MVLAGNSRWDARLSGRSSTGHRMRLLETDGNGRWHVDGTWAPHLDGCMDVDLESSASINALPVHLVRGPLSLQQRLSEVVRGDVHALPQVEPVRAVSLHSGIEVEYGAARIGGTPLELGEQHLSYAL